MKDIEIKKNCVVLFQGDSVTVAIEIVMMIIV